MEGFWFTLVLGLGSLLAVSVLVALVEYLREGVDPAQPAVSPMPRALSVDVDVDSLMPSPDAPGTEPRVVMTEVLQRVQQSSAEGPWDETTPMVLAQRHTADQRPG